MAVGRNDSRSDPAVVGRTVSFNNEPFTVIGVAPKGFIGTEVAYAPEFFVPLMMAKDIEPGSNWLEQRDSDNIFVVGRLKPGVTAAQAKSGCRRSPSRWGKNIRKKMPAAGFS